MQHYDDGSPVPEDTAERVALAEVRDWFRQWHYAWEAMAEQGSCDGLGSHEYCRLTAQARYERVPANQTAMRKWIRERTNVPPPSSMTAESLAKREARAKERSEDHAG
jgi:hypothetical protein